LNQATNKAADALALHKLGRLATVRRRSQLHIGASEEETLEGDRTRQQPI
jgi:hypothetical protein